MRDLVEKFGPDAARELPPEVLPYGDTEPEN
jgi:hypothetical protein